MALNRSLVIGVRLVQLSLQRVDALEKRIGLSLEGGNLLLSDRLRARDGAADQSSRKGESAQPCATRKAGCACVVTIVHVHLFSCLIDNIAILPANTRIHTQSI